MAIIILSVTVLYCAWGTAGCPGGGGELCLEGETDTGISVFLKIMCVPLLYVLLGCVCVLCVHFLLAPPIPLGAW